MTWFSLALAVLGTLSILWSAHDAYRLLWRTPVVDKKSLRLAVHRLMFYSGLVGLAFAVWLDVALELIL